MCFCTSLTGISGAPKIGTCGSTSDFGRSRLVACLPPRTIAARDEIWLFQDGTNVPWLVAGNHSGDPVNLAAGFRPSLVAGHRWIQSSHIAAGGDDDPAVFAAVFLWGAP